MEIVTLNGDSAGGTPANIALNTNPSSFCIKCHLWRRDSRV